MSEKISLLIVDDIAETRENIRKFLAFESDVDVVGMARTGKEGIQLAQELDPDVVLMDINMPDIDGITATEVIRIKSPYIQVIILSIQGDKSYMRKAILAGARDFLTKPPLGDELIRAVRKAGELAKAERLNGRSQRPNAEALLFRERSLKLTWFDLDTRLDLYKESVIDGKLVDEIESLVIGLAHDIRSPINIILSILGTIESTNKKTLSAVKKIRRRSIYCKWVADNFLGISLSEKISLSRQPLRTIVAESIALLKNRTHEGIKILNNINKKWHADVDIGLLQLVLLNLILNSLESMPETGKISLHVVNVNKKMAVFVEDNGAAISSEDVQNLFKLGFTTKKSHAGFGLYVSKRLLKQQSGDLYFARDFHNNTKIFGVLLPNNQQEPQANSDDPDMIMRRIRSLENLINMMWEELTNFRNQNLTESQQVVLSKKFQELTTTFSKNLSNELLVIEATVQVAIKNLPKKDVSTEAAFRKIIRNCTYCRLLTNNILALGEGAVPEMEDLSLIDIFEEVLALVDRKMPPHLYSVDWDVDPLLPNIRADSLQMKQVFMNLVKNALDAMPHGGSLKLKLMVEEASVVAEVEDTGVGIPPENLPKLFQLGFTTKSKGYGIGLFSIKKIIESHNGKIEVSSVEWQGTIFKVKLPLASQEEE